MKFIKFDEFRINLELVTNYYFDGDQLEIRLAAANAIYLKGDRAAALVALLDKAIGVTREEP